VKAALDRADRQAGRDARTANQLEALVTQLETDAGAADARDAGRLRLLAATLKDHAARVR
jgi:hypothetical protein